MLLDGTCRAQPDLGVFFPICHQVQRAFDRGHLDDRPPVGHTCREQFEIAQRNPDYISGLITGDEKLLACRTVDEYRQALVTVEPNFPPSDIPQAITLRAKPRSSGPTSCDCQSARNSASSRCSARPAAPPIAAQCRCRRGEPGVPMLTCVAH